MVTIAALLLAIGSRLYGLFFRLGFGALLSGRSDAMALATVLVPSLVVLAAVWKGKRWGDILAVLLLAFFLFGEIGFIQKMGFIGSWLEETWTVVRLAGNGLGAATGILAALEHGRRRQA